MIVIGERERIRIVQLLGHLTQRMGPSTQRWPTALRMLYLSVFYICVAWSGNTIKYNSNCSTWFNHRAGEWGVRLVCHRSHTSSAPIVPQQGHFLSALLVRQSCAKPAALVYYKRRDCSIQSLQQRTFKFQFLSYILFVLHLFGGCETGL